MIISIAAPEPLMARLPQVHMGRFAVADRPHMEMAQASPAAPDPPGRPSVASTAMGAAETAAVPAPAALCAGRIECAAPLPASPVEPIAVQTAATAAVLTVWLAVTALPVRPE